MRRLAVVGDDAARMGAATVARRRDPGLDVLVLTALAEAAGIAALLRW